MTAPGQDHPRTWRIQKAAARGSNGVVVSQHVLASEAGADVLNEGGNAIDAAVTTALAMGVLEPWLSGIGGGGLMLAYDAHTRRVHGLDFGMISPRRLEPARYPLADDGVGRGLFGWPRVEEDRNLEGFDAICVPGAVDGLGTALAEWGTIPWRRALGPAIEFARQGLLIDWYATLSIATASGELRRSPTAERRFMPDGNVPVAADGRAPVRLPLDDLADTLAALANSGFRDFYDGEIARRLVAELNDGGSALQADDLSAYRSREVSPMTAAFAGSAVHAVPGLTGGPTLIATLDRLEHTLTEGSAPSPDDYVAIARAIRLAYGTRMASMGHAGGDQSCTTHISVIDREGNMVALTNTLLARFGSKVVLEATGILMNNGVMWFDPVPGRANSIHPAVRPLANMCPVILTDGGAPIAALGAAGGRRIVPALAQIITYLRKYGMAPDRAAIHPRLDASEDHVTVDEDMPREVRDRLAAEFDTRVVRRAVYPPRFSVPSVAAIDHGERIGSAYPEGPWPGAVVT